MRTTLNIDEELLATYKRLAAHTHHSLSHVIQDALREALTLRSERAERATIRLAALPENDGVLPGVDLSSHAALTEVLEQPGDTELRRHLRGAAGASAPRGGVPADDTEPA